MTPDHRTTRVPTTLAVGAAAALLALKLVFPDGLTGDLVYLGALLGAAVVALAGVRSSPHRTMALLLALGVAISAGGDAVWQVLEWQRGVGPDVSPADALWLGAYVLVGAALLRSPNGDRRIDRDGLVDVAVVTLVALLVQWELAFDEIMTDASTPIAERVVWSLYPALDAVLLALLVRAVLTRRLRGPVGLLLGGGIACWLVADFAYTLFAATGAYDVWLSLGWMLGSFLLAAAVWQHGPVHADRSPAPRRAGMPTSHGGIAIALVPLLVPGAIEVTNHARGEPSNPYLLYGASVLLVALAFTRGARILQAENEARAALHSQERYARAVARNSADALAIVDHDGTMLRDAPQLAALVGPAGWATAGEDLFGLVETEDLDDARTIFARSLDNPGHTFETELRVRHRDGHLMWLGARLVNLADDPDVGGIVVNLHDITDRKVAEAELSHQAFHDGLTDLANRALFSDRVEHALHRNARTGLHCAVVFLDLDGFKTVNDSLGHGAGDRLLREVATRLSEAVRTGDTVARLGGDEFAILIEQSSHPVEESEGVAERILRSLGDPIELDGQLVTVSASLGIAADDGDSTAASLLRDADVAMYQAKTSGKARWVIYDPTMRSAAVERLQLENDLIGAVEAGQLVLAYQPVIQLETEDVVGFEALLRWDHPTMGRLTPDRFIPIAEETGLIVPIGRWVLGEACATAARWHGAHPQHSALSMAVNVSARQIASADLVGHVREALTSTGLDPRLLVLEMTETALIQDATVAAARLHELRDLGVRLAIDDFGTGYSSLSYLRQFPVDILKIDRSFISTITDRTQVPAIVRGLLDLGHTLELETVAEGVELSVQRDQLRGENCDLAQGFLFSRPLTPEDAELLLAQLPPRPIATTPDLPGA